MNETNWLRSFSFSSYMTAVLVISSFPLYYAYQGYSAAQIGILYAIGPFISMTANLVSGLLSDRFRTIKLIFHILLAGQLAAMLFVLQAHTFTALAATMLFFYVFQTPMNTLIDGMSLHSSSHTGVPFALIRIAGSLGFAFGAVAFGYLLEWTGPQATVWVTLCTIFITLLLSFKLRDYNQHNTHKPYSIKEFGMLIRRKEVVFFFVILFLMSIAHRMNEGFLAYTMHELGASDSLIGYAWLASAVSEMPIFFWLGNNGHRFRELPLLAFASTMYALRFLLASLANDPMLFIPIQAMHSLSFGIFLITALRYIQFLIPDAYRSSGQALFAVVWIGCAGLTSGTLGGLVYEHFGREWFYWVATVLALTAALLFMFKHRWLTKVRN